MRDVKSLLRSGTDEELEELFCVMEDVNVRLEDWLDVGHRSDSSDVDAGTDDDTDDTADDGASGLGGEYASLREDDAPRARRPASRREALSAASGRLGSELANLPGRQRGETQSDVQDVRSGLVGSPGLGVKRMTTVEVTTHDGFAPTGNRPRKQPAPARKEVSRARTKPKSRKKAKR